MSVQHCCDLHRRNLVADHPTLNGIDWIEVLDRDLPAKDALRQRTLLVRALKPWPAMPAETVAIEGGERVRGIRVEWVARATAPLPPDLAGAGEAAVRARINAMTAADRQRTLVVRCSEAGDFSVYRLVLRQGANDPFDPRLSAIAFRFKVECPSEFDCADAAACPPAAAAPQDIDYLARDYPSFRRLLLDRIAQKSPAWRLDSVPDGGMAVVELLAYVGDQLAYRQDAVATEAYLGTARRRQSLRRHAALVDYAMHDGCNARSFVHLRVRAGFGSVALPRAGTTFLTRCADLPNAVAPDADSLRAAFASRPQIFEPLLDARLHEAHNEIAFHTWSDARCCLPRGTTRATLSGEYPDLAVGDFLLFEEVLGPKTGLAADADPAHRHVVRLTRKLPEPGETLSDPLDGQAICEIEWAAEDALPFPLCLSSVSDAAHGAIELSRVSVARGNLVLADHGHTQPPEPLAAVPAPRLRLAVPATRCDDAGPPLLPARYRPRLAQSPVSCAAPLPAALASAAAAMRWDRAAAQPQIALKTVQGADWVLRRSLLKSPPGEPDYVAETDDAQRTQLRFGDDRYGRRPLPGTQFLATYRVGQGEAGNVGADALVHVACANHAAIESLRNPLAARGGVEPESAAAVRRRAPQAFRTQRRAVTEADYASVTEQFGDVQRAQARLRWTGSWHTMFVAVDRAGAAALPPEYEAQLVQHVDRFRMAGHDLQFDEPRYVALGITLHVCVKPDYFRAHVKAALLEALGSRRLADGRIGLFHPDRFSFGQTVYLSPIYAAAHAVAGVDSVKVTAFGPQDAPDPRALADGRLELGRLQIARLDNDPNFPERGRLLLLLDGGK